MQAVWLPRFIAVHGPNVRACPWPNTGSVSPHKIDLPGSRIRGSRGFGSTCVRSPLLSSLEYPWEKGSRRFRGLPLFDECGSPALPRASARTRTSNERATLATAGLQLDGERKRRKRAIGRDVLLYSVYAVGFSNRNFAERILTARGSPQTKTSQRSSIMHVLIYLRHTVFPELVITCNGITLLSRQKELVRQDPLVTFLALWHATSVATFMEIWRLRVTRSKIAIFQPIFWKKRAWWVVNPL